jgi:hypothetical protein
MQVIEGKVPIDRGFQFGLVDPFGNPCDLANANEAPIRVAGIFVRFYTLRRTVWLFNAL